MAELDSGIVFSNRNNFSWTTRKSTVRHEKRLVDALTKVLDSSFTFSDDTILDKIYLHLCEKEGNFNLNIVLPWLSNVLREWDKLKKNIKSFALKMAGVVADCPNGFKKMVESGLLEKLCMAVGSCHDEMETPVILGLVKMLSGLVKSIEGAKWFLDSGLWELILVIHNSSESIYVARETNQLIIALVTVIENVEPELCWRIIDSLLAPLNVTKSADPPLSRREMLMSAQIFVNTSIGGCESFGDLMPKCGDYQNVASESSKDSVNSNKKILPTIQLLCSLIDGLLERNCSAYDVNIIFKNYNLYKWCWEQLSCENYDSKLIGWLSSLILYLIYSTMPRTEDKKVTEGDLLDTLKGFLFLIQALTSKRKYLAVNNICVLSQKLADKLISTPVYLCKEDGVTYNFRAQILFLHALPIFIFLKLARITHADVADKFADKLFTLTSITVKRVCYHYRDTIRVCPECCNTEELLRSSVQTLTGILKYLHKDQVIVVFQSLMHLLREFVPDEYAYLNKVTPLETFDLVNKYPKLLMDILDGIEITIKNYNITWSESLETSCVLVLLMSLSCISELTTPMDKRSTYNDADNRKRRQCDKISSWTQSASNSKSIKTQTEESSFLCNSCSCHKKILNNFPDNEMPCSHLKMDCIPPAGMCVCPVCSQSPNNGYFHRYSLPCYAPYGHCGVPPLIPMQWFHGPFLNNNNNVSNGPQGFISASKTSITTNRATNSVCHSDSAQSTVEDENCNNVSSIYDFSDSNRIENKPVTSSIRSEPNVVKNNVDSNHLKNNGVKNFLSKIKLNKNTFTNLLSKNASKKMHFKSDTDIPLTTNLKVKRSDTVCDNYHRKGLGDNVFDRIGSSLRCHNKGDYDRIKINDKEILKSPIYKYADIRIHELSSSLKNIKESIYKLSTKASELNVTDCDYDNDRYKKFYKSIYSEFHDEDVSSWFVNNLPKQSNNRINFSNNDNANRDTIQTQLVTRQNEILPFSTLSMLRKEGTELSTNHFLSENSGKYPGCNNSMKSSTPLHDIPSALNQNKVPILSSVEPVKVKLNKTCKDRITAHIIVPERSSTFRSAGNDDRKNCLLTSNFNKKRLNNLSQRYTNISFKVDYDSFNDSNNFGNPEYENDNCDCDMENECSESDKDKRCNDNKSVSSHTYFHSASNHKKTVPTNNNNYRGSNNISDAYEEDDDRENNWCVQGQVLSGSPVIQSQENTMNIENWLEKNAETSEQSLAVNKSLSNRKHCQLNSLSSLEILSKISEEDEDKFSCLSEGSEQAKSFLLRDKFFYTGNCSKYSLPFGHFLFPHETDNLHRSTASKSKKYVGINDAQSVYSLVARALELQLRSENGLAPIGNPKAAARWHCDPLPQRISCHNMLSTKLLHLIHLAISNFIPPNLALLVENFKNSSLELLGPLLLRKLNDIHWEVRDSALEVLQTLSFLSALKFPAFQNLLLELNFPSIIIGMFECDEESYVRSSAIVCLQKMVQVKRLWEEAMADKKLLEKMLECLKKEPEGIVRKEAVNLITAIYLSHEICENLMEGVYQQVTALSACDLHWEVKVCTLLFWDAVIDQETANQGMIDGVFPAVTFSKASRKIVALTPAEIKKRLKLVLDNLEKYGCLQALWITLNDTSDLEVARKSVTIITKLLKLLQQYGVVEETCGRATVLPEPSSEIDGNRLFKKFDENMNSQKDEDSVINKETGAEGYHHPDSNQFTVAAEEVIKSIVDSQDVELLSSVYHMDKTGGESTKQASEIVVSSNSFITVNEFIEKVTSLNLESVIRVRTEWLMASDDLDSLIDDILAVNINIRPNINAKDCY